MAFGITYIPVNSHQGRIVGAYRCNSAMIALQVNSPNEFTAVVNTFAPASQYYVNSIFDMPTVVPRPASPHSASGLNLVASFTGTCTLAGVQSGDIVDISGDWVGRDSITGTNSLSVYRFKRSGIYSFISQRWPHLDYEFTVTASHASW